MGGKREKEEDVDEDEIGHTILREEFDTALKDICGNNAPGVDDIPLGLLICLGELAITKLMQVVRKIYETEEKPQTSRRI